MRLELDRKNNWWLEGRIISTWEISEEYEKLADALEVSSNETHRLTALLRECGEVVDRAAHIVCFCPEGIDKKISHHPLCTPGKARALQIKLAEFKEEP